MSETTMRAKMRVTSITEYPTEGGPTSQETIAFAAVGLKTAYPADGSDENNSFARWTPCADASFTIQNPALFGKFAVSDEFYVDFTKAPVDVPHQPV